MEEVWQDISLCPLQDNSRPLRPADAAVPQRHEIGNFHDFFNAADRSLPEPIPQKGISFPVFPHLGSPVFQGSSTPLGGGGGTGDKKSLSGEQWHKRRIKNRESADRSRARKQELPLSIFSFSFLAYTQELELKVDRLKKENAKLRRLLHLEFEVVGAELPKKNTLCRTLTAPF
ncbi:Protein FD [Linum perenne]